MDERGMRELMGDIAVVMRSYVSDQISPLLAKISALEADLAETKALRKEDIATALAQINGVSRAVQARLATLKDGEDADPKIIKQMVEEAVAAIPKPKNGDSVTVDDVAPLIEAEVAKKVSAIPPAKPGKDADPELIERMVAERVAEAVAAIPPPEPGKPGEDADEEAIVARLDERLAEGLAEVRASIPELPDIPALVAEAVAAIPVPENGKDVDPDEVAALVDEKVRTAVEALPPPEKGDAGPIGSLPVVRAWEDRVYYQGDVVSHKGNLYQASADTGREPPHSGWVCIVSRGKDADEIEVKSTYNPDEEYKRLNIVALNGAAFISRKDSPGPCPGDGWQMIAMQGKPGKPGRGEKGDKGDVITSSVVKAAVNEDGLLTIHNANGTAVDCDLYPLLSRLG